MQTEKCIPPQIFFLEKFRTRNKAAAMRSNGKSAKNFLITGRTRQILYPGNNRRSVDILRQCSTDGVKLLQVGIVFKI